MDLFFHFRGPGILNALGKWAKNWQHNYQKIFRIYPTYCPTHYKSLPRNVSKRLLVRHIEIKFLVFGATRPIFYQFTIGQVVFKKFNQNNIIFSWMSNDRSQLSDSR
jgi:hypothetical protein